MWVTVMWLRESGLPGDLLGSPHSAEQGQTGQQHCSVLKRLKEDLAASFSC